MSRLARSVSLLRGAIDCATALHKGLMIKLRPCKACSNLCFFAHLFDIMSVFEFFQVPFYYRLKKKYRSYTLYEKKKII